LKKYRETYLYRTGDRCGTEAGIAVATPAVSPIAILEQELRYGHHRNLIVVLRLHFGQALRRLAHFGAVSVLLVIAHFHLVFLSLIADDRLL